MRVTEQTKCGIITLVSLTSTHLEAPIPRVAANLVVNLSLLVERLHGASPNPGIIPIPLRKRDVSHVVTPIVDGNLRLAVMIVPLAKIKAKVKVKAKVKAKAKAEAKANTALLHHLLSPIRTLRLVLVLTMIMTNPTTSMTGMTSMNKITPTTTNGTTTVATPRHPLRTVRMTGTTRITLTITRTITVLTMMMLSMTMVQLALPTALPIRDTRLRRGLNPKAIRLDRIPSDEVTPLVGLLRHLRQLRRTNANCGNCVWTIKSGDASGIPAGICTKK